MKRAVIWFLLSCKRCLRKGIFPLLLLLMPLAAFVAGRLSDKEEGEIPVAVSVSGEEDVSERSLAWRLAERLADRKDGMFDFYICSDEAQVRDEVASRRAECGYVIDSGLEEKLDQMNCILNDLTEIKTEFKNSSHEQRQLLNRMRVQADELDRLRKANVELALSNKKSEDRFRLFLLISFLWVALLLFIWVLTVKALRIKKP